MGDCTTDLSSIAKQCGGSNTPGLKKRIYVVDVDDVDTVPANVDHEVADITLKAGKFWKEFNIDEQDQQLVSEPSGDDENASINTTVQYFIPRIDAAKSKSLNAGIGAEFLIVAENKKGKKVLVGAVDDGASMQVRKSTTEKDGYVVTHRWSSAYLPYFYTGTTPLS